MSKFLAARLLRVMVFEEDHGRKINVHMYSFILGHKPWFRRIKKTQRMSK